MTFNDWVRQIHRWLSIVFTAAVVATSVALGREDAPAWASYLPLPPLALLLPTGLYLFVLPYAAKWRRARLPD